MVKRLIQLVVAAALIYAGYHAGVVYLHHYQFTDALGEMALFANSNTTEDGLKEGTIEAAQKYEIPLNPDDILIRHDQQATQITAPYVAPVRLLPNYIYQWHLEAKASVIRPR